jgi:hypothetical protein
MADRLRFHRLVAADLRDAIAWYDDVSAELGDHFRATVDACFDEIAEHPERFPHAFGDIRFAVPAIPRNGGDARPTADCGGIALHRVSDIFDAIRRTTSRS